MYHDDTAFDNHTDTPIARYCGATTRAGTACRAYAMCDSAYCYRHDPDLDLARHDASRRGGENRANVKRLAAVSQRMPPEIAPLVATLYNVAQRLQRGDMPASHAQALSAIAGRIIEAYSVSLDAKLDDLEATVAGAAPQRLRVVGG